MPHVKSLQITFHEAKPSDDHPMPPGGFRLAVINATNLPAAHAARRLLAAGEISARELTQAVLERIDAVDGQVRAYLTLTPEDALAAADRADAALIASMVHSGEYTVSSIKDSLAGQGIPVRR